MGTPNNRQREVALLMDSTRDQKWVDELYIENSKKMLSIAMRHGFLQEEAEEIVQDAFLLLLSKSECFQSGHNNPGGFLMESLKNLMGTHLRHKKILQFVPYDKIPEVSITDTYFSSLENWLPDELSDEDKILLVARYEEQIPYAELSGRLGISPNQCALKIFRAKRKLRTILEKEKTSDS